MTEVPTDIIFSSILPRLPGISVLRFKCVSKEWYSSLTSSLFKKMHLHHQNHRKLLLFTVDTTAPCTFRTIDCESPKNGLTNGRSLPFIASSSKCITILGSCNGLVCVGATTRDIDRYYNMIIIWNPLTGEYKRVSDAYFKKKSLEVTGNAFELYYDASADNYKLLRVTGDGDAYIYSLEVDSWRTLYSTEDLKRRIWGASILHCGKIYLIDKEVRRSHGQLWYSVVSFDTNTEKFTLIATPRFGYGTMSTDYLSSMLFNKDGKVHLCVIYRKNSTKLGGKLWMLDGDGYWTEVIMYEIPERRYSLKPLHLMKNGNWLTVCRSGCHVNQLDPARDFNKSSYAKTAHRIDFRGKGIYIETFVSPNPKKK